MSSNVIKTVCLVMLPIVVGAAYIYRYHLSRWGWMPLHGAHMTLSDCRDISGAVCPETATPSPWSPTQIGHGATFDRPAYLRLRAGVVDAGRVDTLPAFVVEFPYPPIALDPRANWRDWETGTRTSGGNETQHWRPPYAALFGSWAIGRRVGESWTGQHRIPAKKYCHTVVHDPRINDEVCVLNVHDERGNPLTIYLSLAGPLEWHWQLQSACEFGGVVRGREQNALRWTIGGVEYSDRGCRGLSTKTGD